MKGYSPKLQVSFDTYQVVPQGRITRDVELRNVMAILPGRSPRRIYVSGHYDTVARPGGQGAANAGGRRRPPIPTRGRRLRPIPTRRSTTSRRASTTTAAARR